MYHNFEQTTDINLYLKAKDNLQFLIIYIYICYRIQEELSMIIRRMNFKEHNSARGFRPPSEFINCLKGKMGQS